MASLGYFPVNTPGSHDTGPLTHDYYKRAVYRAAPRCFEVDSLPPTKFGSSYCFGLRISPVHGDAASSKTGATIGGYNIWRRWEDCLWFQDMLELRYGVISREKRQRLQAGKGVKKNGIYIHDRAASFESLPPGPDPKSVATDIHKYLPRLTKRGSLFRQTQQTVNQRQDEFVALVKAFFQEDVPALVRELRQDRIIRDFFGYWRRDYDLASKEKRPKTTSDAAETNTIFSSLFSQSSHSLSLPSPTTPSPPTSTRVHRSPSISRWRPRAAESMISLPDAESAFSRLSRIIPRRSAASAPAHVGATFRDDAPSEDERHTHQHTVTASPPNGSSSSSLAPSSANSAPSRLRAKSHGAKTSSPTRAESFNVASDFPLFLSTSTRDLLPSSRPPQSPTYATPGLGTLPEDGELGSPISSLPPPTPRTRKDANIDRAHRNCIVWNDTDEVSSTECDVPDQELQESMLKETVTKYTSSSSLPSSIALSNFSPQSRRSSWRTSSEMAWPASPSSSGSPLDPDFPRWMGTESDSKLVCSIPLIPTAGGNGLTMHRSHPGRRPRSLSQPQPLDIPVPAELGDGGWSDLGEDFIDAYFGGSESFSVPNEDKDENLHDDDVGLPLDIGEDLADPASLFHRYHSAYVDDPDDLSPFPLATAHPAQQPPYPHSPTAATTPTLLGVPPGSQMVTVKTVLDNSIVVFRVRRDVALVELRRRVHEKFARTESIALHGAFALAYFIPTDGNSGRRASSMSGDFSRALPIWDEEDWQDAVTRCGSKITLQVYYPSS